MIRRTFGKCQSAPQKNANKKADGSRSNHRFARPLLSDFESTNYRPDKNQMTAFYPDVKCKSPFNGPAFNTCPNRLVACLGTREVLTFLVTSILMEISQSRRSNRSLDRGNFPPSHPQGVYPKKTSFNLVSCMCVSQSAHPI